MLTSKRAPSMTNRHAGFLTFAAWLWLVGGVVACAATWPPPDSADAAKAGSVLLLVVGTAMATVCWIGVAVLGALDRQARAGVAAPQA